ncbi:MAG: hypothetical protein ACRCZ9_08085 [Fusobacteriaceae bacterium]
MYNIALGQTVGTYSSILLDALPQANKGAGSVIICLRFTNCPNEIFFDLTIGNGTCPRVVSGSIRQSVDITLPILPQMQNFTSQISSLLPELAINWVYTISGVASATLTGTITGTQPIYGSVYGDLLSTITLNYANPAISTAATYQAGTPFLLNYPNGLAVVPPVAGSNSVTSGVVSPGAIACPTPVVTGAVPCPPDQRRFSNFVGVVGAKGGKCCDSTEIITQGAVKIKTGVATNPQLYSAGPTLPFLYINATTKQFEIRYLYPALYPIGVAGLQIIGQIRTLEVTPYTAIIIL